MSTDDPLSVLSMITSPRGFVIIPVHYSHDPDKGEMWRREERAKYTDDVSWAREQELDFGSVAGALAYPNFRREVHLVKGLSAIEDVPICLAVDFNVEPMVWECCQILHGKTFVFDEIKLIPGSTQQAVAEFRRRYPAHPGGVRVYGDSTGAARSTPTAQSDYDVMKLSFRSYPTPVEYRVPPRNPLVRDRLNAVNERLKDVEGQVMVKVDALMCPELVADFAEVIMDVGNGSIYKSRKRDEQYFYRTHASDAFGYLIAFEFPVLGTLIKLESRKKKRKPRQFAAALGGI